MICLILGGESADNVGCQGDIGDILLQEVADLIELFDEVLSVHLVKYVIGTTLDWDMKEGIDSRMVQNVCHRIQVLQDVGRIGHAHSEHGRRGHYIYDLFQ